MPNVGAAAAVARHASCRSSSPPSPNQCARLTRQGSYAKLEEPFSPRSRQTRQEALREADDVDDARGRKEAPEARLTRKSTHGSTALQQQQQQQHQQQQQQQQQKALTLEPAAPSISMMPARRANGGIPGLEALGWDKRVQKLRGPSGRVFEGESLGCLWPQDQPRRSAIQLSEQRWFDALILVVIVANCCTMAWHSPLDPAGTAKAHFLERAEWFFLIIFTAELLVKVSGVANTSLF